MTDLLPLTRRVENDEADSVTVIPKDDKAMIEIGTARAVVQIPFTQPNDLRALAGHLMAVADAMQQYQQGGG